METTNRDLADVEREAEELRRQATAVLEAAGDGDLVGDQAVEFDRLAGLIEARNAEIVEIRNRRDRANALVRGIQNGSVRTEGGAAGQHTAHGAAPGYPDQDRAPQTRDLAGLRLCFDNAMARSLTDSIITRDAPAFGLAANGAVVVDQGFNPDPVALGKPANSLLSVLPIVQWPTAQFAFLRQSARTNVAGIVSEGADKHESTYTLERVPDQLDVIAHLSQGIPRYWFADNSSLQAFIASEMLYGLRSAVETMAMSDIAGDNATQPNAFSDEAIVTLRHSVTMLELEGYEASSFVLHPNDWESIELLLSTTDAVEHLSLPFDSASRRLYGIPIVVTNAQTQYTAHTLSTGCAGLNTDSLGVSIQWSEASNDTDFQKNLVRARCEGRYATSVFLPRGIVESDIGGGS